MKPQIDAEGEAGRAPTVTAYRDLQRTLADLPRIGTLRKDRGYRQVWRFEHGGQAFYLKFYPTDSIRMRLKRLFRGSPAMREFRRLQWLQKAEIPAPRAVAVLLGYRLEGRRGDAVILEAIEPGLPLDEYLVEHEMQGRPAPDHLCLAEQVRTLVHRLGQAGLGHADLHLGNFLRHEGRLYLLDAYAVHRRGLRRDDLMRLGHSVSRFATKTDLQRGWRLLGEGERMPLHNPVSPQLWQKQLQRITGANRYFGRLSVDHWQGSYFKTTKYPARWSRVSQMAVGEKDWLAAWPRLLQRIESDQLKVLKRTRSGDVLEGEVVLGGRPVPVIIKRPKRKFWHRYINEIGRGVRARRAWRKSWRLIVRDIPTAWPLLLMERRRFGYVTDAIIVIEKVPGMTLATVDLEAMAPPQRQTLFHRTGRLLRLLERGRLYHWDAKAHNWIVREDEALGPTPVLIDVDGIRIFKATGLAIERLLRSMRNHPQYTPQDSYNLCKGYAPYARLALEGE